MCIKEATAGKGFADAIYIPVKNDRPALIVELKRNQTKESALDQIRDKRYHESLSNYSGRMELSSEEYSLSSLVVDLYNLIRFRTEAKGLDLSFVIDPDIPHLLLGDTQDI